MPRLPGYRSTPPDLAEQKLEQLDASVRQSIHARDRFPRSNAGPAALRADVRGLKNIIPPRHADSEAARRIAEMMQHVETPQSQAQTGLGLAMMHIVMHHVVGEIADDKTRQHRIPKGQAEQKPHDRIGNQHDRSAEQHRHDEAQRIARMHVMDAMDQEMNFGAQTSGKCAMEQQAVAEIFDQGPNKITKRRGAKDWPGIVSFQTQAREDENQRQINKQRRGPMDARQFV